MKKKRLAGDHYRPASGVLATDWETFWNKYPVSVGEQEFLLQVGHTVDGRPYSMPQFEAMIASIEGALQLNSVDVLLDVCCGNGIVTRALARRCRRALGIDFSAPLIDVACKFHAGTNVDYEMMNALELDSLATLADGPFTRVLMYAALQHFQPHDLKTLLEGFLRYAANDRIILFGGVLDAAKKHLFLDTPQKKLNYELYRRQGRDRLGTWWDQNFIREVCNGLGLRCEIDDQSTGRPGGHYRFDAKIS